MSTPSEHAFLSSSSAHRWLRCTAAPHFEANFPATTSPYAEEGRVAHSVCELYANKHFSVMPKSTFTRRLNKLKKDEYFNSEMLGTAETYIEHLNEVALNFAARPFVAFETQVDFSEYVPEGFGTCDCIMLGEDTIHITDYKHGKGVAVTAEHNPQMMLYALGALKKYLPIFGNRISKVTMSICQPRISQYCEVWAISVDDLAAWGEFIKPIAQEAFDGPGTFEPGEAQCRFCRGKAQCRARANTYSAFNDFKDIPIEGKLSPEEKTVAEINNTPVLTDNEVGKILKQVGGLELWIKDLKEYALQAILAGKSIPGWKLVEGRSNRAFSDVDKAIEAAMAAGYDEALLYERKPITLTAMEKLLSKKNFDTILGEFVVKPKGKPALALESDKRQPYSSVVSDFAEVAKNG